MGGGGWIDGRYLPTRLSALRTTAGGRLILGLTAGLISAFVAALESRPCSQAWKMSGSAPSALLRTSARSGVFGEPSGGSDSSLCSGRCDRRGTPPTGTGSTHGSGGRDARRDAMVWDRRRGTSARIGREESAGNEKAQGLFASGQSIWQHSFRPVVRSASRFHPPTIDTLMDTYDTSLLPPPGLRRGCRRWKRCPLR